MRTVLVPDLLSSFSCGANTSGCSERAPSRAFQAWFLVSMATFSRPRPMHAVDRMAANRNSSTGSDSTNSSGAWPARFREQVVGTWIAMLATSMRLQLWVQQHLLQHLLVLRG